MNGLTVFTIIFFVLGPDVSLLGQQASSDTINSQRILTITGVGDVMMGTAFPSDRYLPPGNDPAPLIDSVKKYLAESDLVFANLEGPFSDYAKLAKRCKDTTRCYAFRVPEQYISVFHDAGFNLVSLANNHIGDFGLEGRDRTIRLFDSLGIKYAGPHDYPYSIFSKDSVIYGFAAFSPNKGTLNITDLEYAGSIVKMLDDTCDVVIVSFHGGAEGADYQNVTMETESFYGENRGNVYEFSHRVIDAGADIVFGHGPHVTRAIEVYKNRIIAYSLGNFCTYRRFNLTGPNGFAPVLRVKTDISGNFVEADIVPVYQDNLGHVKYDPQRRVIKRIKELVGEDFPDSAISISSDGKVIYKHEND